jgi:hypothetical protein
LFKNYFGEDIRKLKLCLVITIIGRIHHIIIIINIKEN